MMESRWMRFPIDDAGCIHSHAESVAASVAQNASRLQLQQAAESKDSNIKFT